MHLILCSLIVVSIFVGLLWLGFILSFGSMSDGLRSSATSYLEDYLSGQIPAIDEVSEQLYFDLPVRTDIEMIGVTFKPDYLATLLEPCRTLRCNVKDEFYRVSATYEVEGELVSSRFLMVWNPSSYYWRIEKGLE